MKRLYWRPAGPSRAALVALAALAVGLLVLVEGFPRGVRPESHELKLEAAHKAEQAFHAIRAERPRRGLPPFEPTDTAETGLIGAPSTEITTSSGSLVAKRTTANPNFAALIVEFLGRLDLRAGDTVAIGYSGSFPAWNIAVLAALDAMELNPLVITSAAASDYGASSPSFSWLDMETLLRERGIFSVKSLAASVGGIEDQGVGLSQAGHDLLLSTIERNGIKLIEAADFKDSLNERMRLYDAAARGRPIRAYINVGGGTVSVGRSSGKAAYKAGINRPGIPAPVDSIIGRFLDRGTPALHLVRAEELAQQYGLPIAPERRPQPGTGAVFGHTEPNRWLAAGALLTLVVALGGVGLHARQRAQLESSGGD